MRRTVMWGMIAVLGIPVIAAAQEQRLPSDAGNNAVAPASAAPGATLQYAPGTVEYAPRVVQYLTGVTQTTEPRDSKYWIGLSCGPIDEALRSQLGLEAGGLAIRQIVDNSPASEAGLSVHDVIVEMRIADQAHKLADVTRLTTLVQQAEGKPMTLSVLRRGKPLNVTVTPRERNVANPQQNPNWVVRTTETANPLFFRMAGPVVAFGGTNTAPANLPDDLTVVITKSGSQPVEIAVLQKGRGEWRLKERETAAQPDNVSRAVIDVLSYLSRLTGRVDAQEGKQVFRLEPNLQATFGIAPLGHDGGVRAVLPTDQPARVLSRSRPAPTPISVQQRLDEIQKQQEQVTKTLNELRQSLQKSQPQN